MDNKKFPYEIFGEKLKQLRGDKTKTAFAKMLGVTLQTYIRYESGQRKIPDGLFQLAQILNPKQTEEKKPKSNLKKTHTGTVSERLSMIVQEQAGGKATVFAEKAGIPLSTFYGYLNGRTPNIEHLIRIIENYDVNTNWLLTGCGVHHVQTYETEYDVIQSLDFKLLFDIMKIILDVSEKEHIDFESLKLSDEKKFKHLNILMYEYFSETGKKVNEKTILDFLKLITPSNDI